MSKWKDCVKYMQNANALPPLSEVTKRAIENSDPNIAYEIARYLKDGVVLCRLLNGIKQNALPKKNFSSRPQHSSYLAKKNILAFLNACETVFRMPKKDLFDVDDLLLERNLDKVLITISKLSQTKLAQDYFGNGFVVSLAPPVPKPFIPSSVPKGPPPPRPFVNNDNSQIYGNDSNDFMNDVDEKEVYESFMGVERKLSLPEKDLCTNELISSEKSYIELLNILINKFKIPLSNVLPKSSLDKIFFKIEELLNIHTSFLKKLEMSQQEDSFLTLADHFIGCKEWFLFYGDYCANVTEAQNHIDDLMKTPEYRSQIEQLEQNYQNGKHKLRNLFVIPMQRILKYPLFMKRLLELNENSNEGLKKTFAKAIEETEVDLAQYINEVKRDVENLKNIEKIEKSIKKLDDILHPGAHLKDYGKLVKDGELKSKELDKECVVFLFDKLLIICTKTKGDLLDFKSCCILSKYQINHQASDKDGRSFTLTNILLTKESITFKAKTVEEKIAWVAAIELSKETSNPTKPPNSPYNFKMHSYDKPTICDVCKKLLKGIFYQGYYCSVTNKNVHKECMAIIQNEECPTLFQENSNLNLFGLVVKDYRGNPKPPVEYNPLHLLTKSVVQITSVRGDWVQGKCDNRKGSFPKSVIIQFNHIPTYEEVLEVFKSIDEMPDTWYAGKLSREDSYSLLSKVPNGTFLVRLSQKPGGDSYVIDIMFNGISSIRIDYINNNYSIEKDFQFHSVKALIDLYEQVSLGAVFTTVPTKLLFPYKKVLQLMKENPGVKLNLCRALFDYIGPAEEKELLLLKKGDIIIVLNTEVGCPGWWQGKLGKKVGYFPCNHVDFL